VAPRSGRLERQRGRSHHGHEQHLDPLDGRHHPDRDGERIGSIWWHGDIIDDAGTSGPPAPVLSRAKREERL